MAVDGRVEIRPIVTLGAFDHRLLDGYQAARLAKRFRSVLADPDRVLGSVASPSLPSERSPFA